MRRVALLLCVLMLAPASGAWSMPELPSADAEWVVIREDGWAHADWVALRSDGLEPLRQITATEVLVWGGHGFYQLEDESVLRGQRADGYRVVLEPRLPSEAQWNILSIFDFEELQLAGMNSALPTSFEIHGVNPGIFDSIPGVWWVEPLLETKARNDLSSSIMENNSMEGHPSWNIGLNGSGVIIGVADSGIELDHGCFRENATTIGEIDSNHRKVVLVNTSIDDGDHSGQEDYRHGTHIAGTLVCDMWNGTAGDGTSPSYGARVLFQDVVNESGWSEPTVDWLLAEALANGVVIHSNSWGDDTEAYTLRSAEFDLWHREVPWALAFIAPGNNANRFFEPANARNVVSVGGSLHDNSSDLYSSSSQGPTEEGLRGNFIVAPAVGIVSAAADGNVSSFNDDMRSSTGTSMSTPMGASITAVIQQMVQDGWFTEEGFVPSGPQLRALLALSSDSMGQSSAPDAQQGWGRPNLANLIDYNTNSSQEIWIHDSYQMNETIRMEMVNEWLTSNGTRPLEQVIASHWNGSVARGPFLKQGDVVIWNLSVAPGEDIDVFLSFNQRPFGAVSDDLDVAVVLPNGTRISSNESLEGTERVSVPASALVGIENVTIEVGAELIGIGNYSGVLGSDGDMIGFSLAIRGVGGEVVEPEPEESAVDEYIHSSGNVSSDGQLMGSTWSDSEYSMIGPFNWWRTSGELLGTNLTEIVMRVEGGEEGDELVSTMVLSSGTKNITHLYWWETTWDDVDGDGEFSIGDAWVVRTGQMSTHSGDYYVTFVRIGSCDWGWTVSECPDGQICSDGSCADENVSEPEPEPEDNNTDNVIDDLQNSGSSEDDLPWVEMGVFFVVVFVGIALFSLRKRAKNG